MPTQNVPNPNQLPQPDPDPVNPVVAPPETLSEFTVAHAKTALKFFDAVSRMYTELQGSSAHDRLQRAKEDLHQCYQNADGAFEIMKEEFERLVAAAEDKPAPEAPAPTDVQKGITPIS